MCPAVIKVAQIQVADTTPDTMESAVIALMGDNLECIQYNARRAITGGL